MKAKNWSRVVLYSILLTGTIFVIDHLTIKARPMTLPKITTREQLVELFPTTVDQINEKVAKIKKEALANIKSIIDLKDEERTFDNTARALDKASAQIGIDAALISILEMVSPVKEIRETANEASLDLNTFLVDHISQNKELYHAFKAYAENNAHKEDLTSEQRYFIEEELKGFKQAGLHLSDQAQEKLKAIKKALGQATLNFDRNIAADNRYITLTKEDLKGVPENFIKCLKTTEDNKYIVGVDYPTYTCVMENACVEKTRKSLWKEFVNRGYPDNKKELETVIKLRDEMAKLIGYKSYADLDIDGEMAHSTQAVESFLNNLIDRSNVKAAQDIKELIQDMPEGVHLTQDGKIKMWDIGYLKNHYKKKNLTIDETALADYFPLTSTVEALYDIYNKFFGLTFKHVLVQGLWHEDVSLLEVSKNNKFIGYVMLDLFPRDNKYSHACQAGIIHATESKQDGYRPAVVLVIANFPQATADAPALLRRDDVVTFFHEFGHAIHTLLGCTELDSQSGTNVKRDFVEMPSQMLEEFMWDPVILKQVSKHYKTGEPISDNIIEKITELKKFGSGLFVLNQLYYASLALELFKEGGDKDISKITKDLYQKIMKSFAFDENYNFYASFGHLTGYGAKYYGYMWSKVFALDLFDTIKKAGYFSGIGEDYINKVIGKGGSQDPFVLLENFLGRKPNDKAFFEDLGL